MKVKEILNKYYELVVTKNHGDKVLNVYKPKGMRDLPQSLIDDYADPKILCPHFPVHGLRYDAGNPDYGEWDAQTIKAVHGKVVDLYVCAILARPFSVEAMEKYKSMMLQLPVRRAALMWDSRDFDETHGYERIYIMKDVEK